MPRCERVCPRVSHVRSMSEPFVKPYTRFLGRELHDLSGAFRVLAFSCSSQDLIGMNHDIMVFFHTRQGKLIRHWVLLTYCSRQPFGHESSAWLSLGLKEMPVDAALRSRNKNRDSAFGIKMRREVGCKARASCSSTTSEVSVQSVSASLPT